MCFGVPHKVPRTLNWLWSEFQSRYQPCASPGSLLGHGHLQDWPCLGPVAWPALLFRGQRPVTCQEAGLTLQLLFALSQLVGLKRPGPPHTGAV